MLCETFENVKHIKGPVLIHIRTIKGKGYKPAEENPEKWHGVGPYKIEPQENRKENKRQKKWSEIFGEAVIELAEKEEKLIVITPAMKSGCGLSKFAEEFPERFFDVGLAEQHAATFAGGLATQGPTTYGKGEFKGKKLLLIAFSKKFLNCLFSFLKEIS